MDNKEKEELLSLDEIKANLSLFAGRHSEFFLYMKEKYLTTIVDKGVLYLSDGTGWNDATEKDNLQDGVKLFAKSLTMLKKENVAMWILYADDCKGNRLRIKKNQLKGIINANRNKECSVGYFNKDSFVKTGTTRVADLFLISIGYSPMENTGDHSIYYGSNMFKTCDSVSKSYFIKNYAWQNEAECRIVAVPEKNCSTQECSLELLIPEEIRKELKNQIMFGPSNKTKQEGKRSLLTGKINWKINN